MKSCAWAANNFRMAQVMQWLPAIRNYMRKVRLKYQHVIANFQSLTASLNTKKIIRMRIQHI